MSDTPLELSQDVLALIVGLAPGMSVTLPDLQWAQLGTPIMTCGSVAVGVLAVREIALYDGKIQCGALLEADVTIGIARDCSIEHDEDGHTDPTKVGLIAALMDKDSELLSAVSEAMPGKKTGAQTTFQVEGGLGVVNLFVSSEVVVW